MTSINLKQIKGGSVSGIAGGDLNGAYPNPTVVKLQGNSVQSGIPNDGYVLTWNAIDNEWGPKPQVNISANLTIAEHSQLRQLIHMADGVGGPFEGFLTGSYRTISGSPLAPTYICWWTNSIQVYKIIDKIITYNEMLRPTIITWNMYNTDGINILATVTDTINYNMIFEISRTRTIVDYNGNCDACTITAQSHETLKQLIHLVDGVGGPFEGFASGAYQETIYPFENPFVSMETWYTDSTKTYKIIEKNVIRNSINMPVTITWQVYNTDGITIVNTAVDTITYANNIFEVSRQRMLL